MVSAGIVCRTAESRVYNRVSRRRTFDLQSDTFEAVFNAFEGFCVAVYIWPRSVQACQVCCSKNRTVGYLLTCCRSVVSGTLLGAITSAGRFIGKEVS